MKKQYFKQILSVLFALIFTLGALPILAATDFDSASPAVDWEGFDEFSSAVSMLLSETMEEDYVSAITLEVGNDEMVVNGKEKSLVEGRKVAAVTKDDVVLLPVRALAECEDAVVSYDTELSAATVQTEDGEIVFTKGAMTAAVSDGKTENSTLTSLVAEPELIDDTMYVPLDTIASFLGYNTESVDDNKLLLTKPYQTKRLIVKSKDRRVDSYGAVQEISGFNDLYILQYETEEDAREAHKNFLLTGLIEFVEPDFVVSPMEAHQSWGTDYIGADTYNQYLQENTNLDEVVVAVVDTGADSEHMFLKDRIIPVNKNFVNSEPNSNDGNSHGTHVSGIIADATLPNVKILPVKTMSDSGYGTSLSVYNGVMFAIMQDCDVINMSFSSVGKSELEQEAVLAAVSENISVVTAAGNDKVDAAMYSPANIEEAITVGAVTTAGKYADFSNYGTVVDIWAPGSSVNSSVPGNIFIKKSGTSMAAPHTAAAAAMLKTYDKTLSPRQIEWTLQKHARELMIGEPLNAGTSKVLSVEMLENFRKGDFPPVEKPQADVSPGDYYEEELVVSLSCATPGATIRYTTDGTIPTATDGKLYTEPLTLRESTRLIAKAFKAGAPESYTLDNLYCVSEYPESLHYQNYAYYDTWKYTYPDTQAKYLKITFDEDSYIPFPNENSVNYSEARISKYGLYIYDADLKTINNEYADIERKYFVYDELKGKSVIVSGNSFTIFLSCHHESGDYGFKVKSVEPLYEDRLSAPEFVMPCGNNYAERVEFSTSMNIGISDISYAENKTVVLNSKEGGEIYYTLDGSIPTKSSLKYIGPIALDEPKKIRARAYKEGYVESEAVSENYYSSKYPESMHYQKRDYYFNNKWEWQAPFDVKYMAVTFDDKTFLGSRDTKNHLNLKIDNNPTSQYYTTEFYGNELAGQTLYMKGNYFKLYCGGELPEGVDAPYGFKITDIRYYYNEDDIIPIESIEISGPRTMEEGQSAQMTAKVTPENANTGFFWRMAYVAPCAAVDQNGVVTGIKKDGVARLLATSNFINSIRRPYDDSDYPDYSFNGALKDITVKAVSAPTGTISYSTIALTNQDVVATVTTKGAVRVVNNGGSNTYTFTENGAFTFELVNSLGETGSVTAEVDWIDKEVPTAVLTYSPQTTTNGEVLVTMHPSEEVTVTNTKNNSRTIRVTENGSVRFEFEDKAGNIGFAEEEVTWIDKSDIAAEFIYEDLPDGRVKAILQTSKPVTVTNNGGNVEHIFSKNGSFTFEYQYEGGKAGSATANVYWSYRAIITYSKVSSGPESVTAYIQLPPDVVITNNGGRNSYVFIENGSFTFEFEERDGRKGRATAKVTWIINDGELNIYSSDELVSFAKLVNNGSSLAEASVRLMQDIDMSGIDWTPIGDTKYKFSGTFDGQNFIIYNLSMNNKSRVVYGGLFGRTTEDAVIRNVRLINCSLTGSSLSGGVAEHYGFVVGYHTGVVKNCFADGKINGGSNIGGIAGYNAGMIEDCSVNGKLNGTSAVGGITGRNSGAVRRCEMFGAITGTANYIGGITGISTTGSVIENCCSAGKVQGTASKNYMGGIAGNARGTIKNCYSICAIANTETNGQYYGGIAGCLSGTLENCVALNPYVLVLNSDIYIGRTVGISDEISNLSNNYAWAGMWFGTEQEQAPVTDAAVSPLTHTNGKGVDKEKVRSKTFWEDTVGFTFGDDGWTWTEGKMPRLAIGESFDWPRWLFTDEELTPESPFSIYYDNVIVTAAVAEAGTYTIIMAAYKEETLIKTEIVEEVFENPGKKMIVPEFQTNEADTVKVMLWYSADSMIPLCEPAEYSL